MINLISFNISNLNGGSDLGTKSPKPTVDNVIKLK